VSEWRDDFPAIAADTIRWLGERGVLLVGTDAPSLDAPDSKTLPAHHALRTFNMMNLEHLNLRDVAPGSYQLVALPLCLKGMDASPVRAVLIRQ
jgi:arylformamidase